MTLRAGSWAWRDGWMFGLGFKRLAIAYGKRDYTATLYIGPWQWWIGVQLDGAKEKKSVRS